MRALVILLLVASPLAGAIIELHPLHMPCVFAGRMSSIDLICRNTSGTNLEVAVDFRLFQSSSTTAAAWTPQGPWRTLRLSGYQKLIETFELDAPAVREQSTFILQFSHRGKVITNLTVLVFPDTITTTLSNTVRSAAVHHIAPGLRTLLDRAGVRVVNLEKDASAEPPPEVIIYGSADDETLSRAIADAKSGKCVVRIYSDERVGHLVAPSYSVSNLGRGTLVSVKQGMLAEILDDPISQLRFLRVLRLALSKESHHPADPEL